MKLAMYYLLIINATAWVIMLTDKLKAKHNAWRIPEATLLAVAALGGSYGALLAMLMFRHKTRKPIFSIGLPLLAILHTVILLTITL